MIVEELPGLAHRRPVPNRIHKSTHFSFFCIYLGHEEDLG